MPIQQTKQYVSGEVGHYSKVLGKD